MFSDSWQMSSIYALVILNPSPRLNERKQFWFDTKCRHNMSIACNYSFSRLFNTGPREFVNTRIVAWETLMALAWQFTGASVDSSLTLGGQSTRWTSSRKKSCPPILDWNARHRFRRLRCYGLYRDRWIGLPVVLKVRAWLGINCEGRLRQEICYLLPTLLEQPSPSSSSSSLAVGHISIHLPHHRLDHLPTKNLQTQRVFTVQRSAEHERPKKWEPMNIKN